MKDEFINFLNALMAENPKLVEELMTDNIKIYIEALTEKEEKSEMTENGEKILSYLQTVPDQIMKAKEIAEGMGISSRSVSGSIRKLVVDKYVEKIGEKPCSYVLTEKGKNYIINKE